MTWACLWPRAMESPTRRVKSETFQRKALSRSQQMARADLELTEDPLSLEIRPVRKTAGSELREATALRALLGTRTVHSRMEERWRRQDRWLSHSDSSRVPRTRAARTMRQTALARRERPWLVHQESAVSAPSRPSFAGERHCHLPHLEAPQVETMEEREDSKSSGCRERSASPVRAEGRTVR